MSTSLYIGGALVTVGGASIDFGTDFGPMPPSVFTGPTSIQNFVNAVPYVNYQNDDAVTAFFEAYNIYGQAYLDWFNGLNLPVYTQSPVSGALLDWVAQSIYGMGRPALPAALGTAARGPVNTFTVNSLPLNTLIPGVPGTYTATSDDIFRRILTWAFYKGDGFVVSPEWLKRRINRFLNGVNGADVPNDTTFDISLSPTGFKQWTIGVTNTPQASIFKIAVEAGVLQLPLQITWTVTLL